MDPVSKSCNISSTIDDILDEEIVKSNVGEWPGLRSSYKN